MGYFVAIIIILLGFLKKNNKVVTSIQIIYMWALIALNCNSSDYWAYEEMYRCCFEPRYATHEIGYILLCKAGLMLGLSYTHFRMIIATIIIFFVFLGYRALTSNINMALSFYLVFGFVGNVSGLRNAIAASILIYASHYLIYDTKKGVWKYLWLICLAIMFHYSAFFYLIFVLCRAKIKPCLMGIMVAITSIGVMTVLKSGIIYKIIISFTNREKTVKWFSGYGSLSISPLYVISIIMIIIFLLLLKHKMILNINNGYISDKYVERTEKIIILSLFSYALAACSSVVWVRLFVATLPIGYGLYACENSTSYEQTVKFKQYNFILYLLCACSFLFVYVYWIGGNMWKAFQNNYLFVH